MSLEDDPAHDLRRITDARTLRALTHPVRLALLEALLLHGAQTATEVGERIGESPTTCSFHLRQLAKYGFVAEAGGGTGRARPWRLTTFGISFGDVDGDQDSEIAANVLGRMVRERKLERLRTWLETRHNYPTRWQNAADDSEWVSYLTADELEELSRDLHDLVRTRFRERVADPSLRPPGSLPVEVILFMFPIAVPE
jgi:predicted ArsR family transcriptional regulator